LKPNKPKLKWYLFTLLGFFVAVNITLIWLFGIYFLDDVYLSVQDAVLASAAEQVAEQIDAEELRDIAAQISFRENVSIMVLTRGGSVYQDVSFAAGIVFNRDQRADFFNDARTSAGGIHGLVIEEIAQDGTSVRTVVHALSAHNAQGEPVVVVAAVTASSFAATTRIAAPMLALASVAVLLFGFGVSFVLYKIVAKPIETLTVSAQDMAAGNADVEFKVKGFREAQELGNTLSYASQELSKTEHLRKELIANVSHDLRTPLTLIISYAELIKDFPENVQPDDVQVVIDEAQRLRNLIESILTLQDEKRLDFRTFDLVPLLVETINRHNILLKHHGYKIELKHDESALVYADEQAISQVVYNLLSNAVNYAGEDKTIKVNQTRKGASIRVEIADNGIGIDVDVLPHIWDRYFKSKQNHRRAHLGTGLGLSIVKNIMNGHPGGVYGVKSSIGKGSTFYFELPVVNSIVFEELFDN
jgi:signal transduction histidine kinase